ncbi:MAG: response regulator transcription factor [Actinobacteria bacterium]|nr:response regulator transcription factor [Actinomycetota bacterium]
MAEPVPVVLVEDDPHIADLVDLYLRDAGFKVFQATTGEQGLEYIATRRPRLVILDLGLPGEIDGLEVCRQLRAKGDLPVVILTARDGEIDRVVGLELGADDYVTKPFSPRELVARVRAVLRRADGPSRPSSVLTAGAIEVDVDRREVRAAGTPVALTAREFDLLRHLAEHPGLVLTRQQLLDAVWGPGWVGDERTVDVHVRQLRRKLGEALALTTVWGVGYRLG